MPFDSSGPPLFPQQTAPQDAGLYSCPSCSKAYKHQPSLWKHRKFECGQEPQFACPMCPYRAKRKHHLESHVASRHRI